MIESYSNRFARMRALIFTTFGEYHGKVPGAPRHQGKPAELQVQLKSLAVSHLFAEVFNFPEVLSVFVN